MKILDVAAGLVFRNGRLLLAQRFAHDHLGGLWEFPGGKREKGETYPKCLQRELREELGIEVAVGALFQRIAHTYPSRRVRLRFYLCTIVEGDPRPLGCQAVCWVTRTELRKYEFPAADAHLIDALSRDLALWRLRPLQQQDSTLP